ncbi:MAG: metalloregulator ArsR/SmtB family transcription factor [Lautropia sp.]|nr:metalloregulator ArsR/SmtB family transcription factor [Lautropia sp.]
MSDSTPSIDPEQMRRHAGEAARLLKGLANARRLMILCMLADGESSVGEINERIDLSQSALSQHLAVLREEGIVTTRRASQTIYYRLADGPAAAVIKLLHELYCSPQGTADSQTPARQDSRQST